VQDAAEVTVAVSNFVSEVVVQTEETYAHTPTNCILSSLLFPCVSVAPDKVTLKYSVGAVLDTLTVKTEGVDEKVELGGEIIPVEPV